VRNDYHGAIVAGAAAGRRASLQSGDGDADLCPNRFVEIAACYGFSPDLPPIFIEKGFRVSIYVGCRAPAAGGGSLPRSYLVAQRRDPAKTRQAGLVASWIDGDRVGEERGWVYSEVRGQAGRHISVPERFEDLRQWRARQESLHGAPLVVVAQVGPRHV